MGWGTVIECKSCGYNLELLEGPGMDYCDLDFLITMLESDQAQKALELKDMFEITRVDGYMKIYECHSCNVLSNYLCLQLFFEGGGKFETTYLCDKCKSHLEIIEEPVLSDYVCPECGNSTLGPSSFIARIDWD